MFKLTSVVMALASTASAATKLQWVPCDAQMSCDAVLSKAQGTKVTGSTCYTLRAGQNFYVLKETVKTEFMNAGFPTSGDSTACF